MALLARFDVLLVRAAPRTGARAIVLVSSNLSLLGFGGEAKCDVV